MTPRAESAEERACAHTRTEAPRRSISWGSLSWMPMSLMAMIVSPTATWTPGRHVQGHVALDKLVESVQTAGRGRRARGSEIPGPTAPPSHGGPSRRPPCRQTPAPRTDRAPAARPRGAPCCLCPPLAHPCSSGRLPRIRCSSY